MIISEYMSMMRSLDCTRWNVVAVVVCFLVIGVWLKITELLVLYGICSSKTSRKLVHITTGPLYIVCWNLFPPDHQLPPICGNISNDSKVSSGNYFPSDVVCTGRMGMSRYYAAIVPLLITIRFLLLGTGFLHDPETVRSISRSGNPRELLGGPLLYGIIFVLSTLLFWRDSPEAIIALMMLCVGDGFAGWFGERWGLGPSSPPQRNYWLTYIHRKLWEARGWLPLPWNRRKTWLGTACFAIFAMFASFFLLDWLHSLSSFQNLWFNDLRRKVDISNLGCRMDIADVSDLEMEQRLRCFKWNVVLPTVLIAALVESLPLPVFLMMDMDNLTVFLASLFAMRFFAC